MHGIYSFVLDTTSALSPFAVWHDPKGEDKQSHNTDPHNQNQHQDFTCTDITIILVINSHMSF